MHKPHCTTSIALTLVILGAPAISLAQSGATIDFTEFNVPSPGAEPTGIAYGPDGALWFTEYNSGKIGRVTTAGVFSEYAVPSDAFLSGIAVGSDGALWFAENDPSGIGRITTAGIITNEYPTLTPNSDPVGIAKGPDNTLWFTEYTGNKIGRITTAGAIAEYALPSPGSFPEGIIEGPDGAMWFTEYAVDKIGRITVTGNITEFPIDDNRNPYAIAVGSDGALWFTEVQGYIGRITTKGVISFPTFPGNGTLGEMEGIVGGSDGALWFTDSAENILGRLTPAGYLTQYTIPTVNSSPAGITSDPSGTVWFTESSGDKIGTAPACGLGLGVTYASGTLDISFDLGTGVAATWTTILTSSTTGEEKLWSLAIPKVSPPAAGTVPWTKGLPVSGEVEIKSTLSNSSGQAYCSEYQSITIPNPKP